MVVDVMAHLPEQHGGKGPGWKHVVSPGPRYGCECVTPRT
ncbi:hypothetical protein [Alloactinosynnema sp. L-07]|nr:hypothetical protein [Alloactinosynnema sp. L-07]